MSRERCCWFNVMFVLVATMIGCGGSPGVGASTSAITSGQGLENAVPHDIIKLEPAEFALIDTTVYGTKLIWYKPAGQYAITDGDIVLGDLASLRRAAGEEGAGVKAVGARWAAGKIPYTIDANLPNKQRVTEAIADWESKTGIRFLARTSESDYVTFKNGAGCSSRLGKAGGQQFVTLGPSCTTGNAIHEIGHLVGLWHEQSRADRDENVIIHYEHVEEGFEHNFETYVQQKADGVDLSLYNYRSIMHYPADAFSKDGQATIEVKDPAHVFVTVGQRDGLSPGDVLAVGTLYCRDPGYRCAIQF